MKKPMLKFTLSALLLSAGAIAFAEGDAAVKLSNGVEIAWDAFVSALNGGVTATGNIEDLPANNQMAINLQTAQTNLTDAQAAQTRAANAFNTAKAAVDAFTATDPTLQNKWRKALNSAQAYRDSFNADDPGYDDNEYVKAIKAAQDTVAAFDATDPEKQNEYAKALAAAKTKVDAYGDGTESGLIYEAQQAINTAAGDTVKIHEVYYAAMAGYKALQDSVGKLQDTIGINQSNKAAWSQTLTNELPGQISYVKGLLDDKYGTTTTTSTPIGWLNEIYTAATTFKNAYNNGKPVAGSSAVIYYQYLDKEYASNYEDWEELNLSFTATEGYTKLTVAEFANFVKTVNKADGKPVAFLAVYMGKNSDGEYNYGGPDGGGFLSISAWDSDSKATNLYKNVYDAIEALTKTAGFYESTTTTTYAVPANSTNHEADKAEMEEWLQELADYKEQQADLNAKIKKANSEITRLQDEIKDLNDEMATYTYTDTKYDLGEGMAQNLTFWKGEYDNAIKAVTDAKTAMSNLLEQQTKDNTALETAQQTFNTKRGEAVAAVTAANKAFNDAKTAAQTALETAQDNYDTNLETANNTLSTRQEEKEIADSNVTKAENALNSATAAAQKEADDIATTKALESYQSVTLTADVIATQSIAKPYAGTIKGDLHVINVQGVSVLFDEFDGKLQRTAINLPAKGAFAGNTTTASQFSYVAAWNGNNYARYYGENGLVTCTSLGELGYTARDFYGVDFATNKLVVRDDDTKVFSIAVQETDGAKPQTYVTYNGTSFIGKNGATVTIPDNRFALSADADIADLNGGAPANVYYGTPGNYICDNAVVVDKVQFYAPVDMTVGAVSIDRKFKKGYNSVCLPFAFSKDDAAGISALCTYDSESPEKFFFQIKEEAIPANNPFLMITSQEVTVTEPINNVTIKATPAKMYFSLEGETPDDLSFGTFAKLNATSFGASGSYKIYGLNGDKFQAAGTNAMFSAFRMAIRSEIVANQQEADNAPRRIALLDSRGIEIGSGLEGIEGVESGSSLDIATGVGEIIFTSEADYGKVEIYSIDGRVVAVADVMAGTSSVNVAKGVYIVMGKKVMVK